MDDLEEFKNWHEDLMEWERFQDVLERIKGENTYEDLHDFEDKTYPCKRKNFTQSGADHCNNTMVQK